MVLNWVNILGSVAGGEEMLNLCPNDIEPSP